MKLPLIGLKSKKANRSLGVGGATGALIRASLPLSTLQNRFEKLSLSASTHNEQRAYDDFVSHPHRHLYSNASPIIKQETIPHPAPCDGKPNMHASEWPTIEESLKICPPKTRGASRLKPRSRFEVYQPRKRLDGKSPKTEEITAFKGRVRKLDLNDDILRLVMDHSGNCFESQLLLVKHLELLKQAGVELCFWRHESEKRDKASKRTNAAVDHVYHCTVDGCISSSDSLQKACQHLTGVHWKLKLFKCTKCPKAWPFGRNATSHEKYDHSPPELSSLHRAIVPVQAFDPASAATAIHPLAPSVPSTTQALEAASSSHQRLYPIQRRPETQASPHAFQPYRRISDGPVGGGSRVHRPAQAPQVSMGTSARGSYAPQHISFAQQTPNPSGLARPLHGRGNPQLMVPSGSPHHPLYAHQPYAAVAAGLAPTIGLSGIPASMRMYPTPDVPLVPPVAVRPHDPRAFLTTHPLYRSLPAGHSFHQQGPQGYQLSLGKPFQPGPSTVSSSRPQRIVQSPPSHHFLLGQLQAHHPQIYDPHLSSFTNQSSVTSPRGSGPESISGSSLYPSTENLHHETDRADYLGYQRFAAGKATVWAAGLIHAALRCCVFAGDSFILSIENGGQALKTLQDFSFLQDVWILFLGYNGRFLAASTLWTDVSSY